MNTFKPVEIQNYKKCKEGTSSHYQSFIIKFCNHAVI